MPLPPKMARRSITPHMAEEASAAAAEPTGGAPGPGLPRPCLTVAGLEEALEAIAAVEALLPAGSALLLELGTLARWLRDVLALGAFLRAAREAHEVSSSQCQMTEASKANATALPPA